VKKEQDWLNCDDSIPMLNFLLANPADTAERKLRLFACACVRRTREFGGREQLHAIELCEQPTTIAPPPSSPSVPERDGDLPEAPVQWWVLDIAVPVRVAGWCRRSQIITT
jgi:hypothetical protein